MVSKYVGMLLTAIAGLANLGVGMYCTYKYGTIASEDDSVPRIFLSVYLAVFGLLTLTLLIPSLRHKLTVASGPNDDPLVGFLGRPATRAMFVFFVGTLGLSFGFSSHKPERTVPFFTGIVTMSVAVVVMCASAFVNVDARDKAAEES